MATWSDLRAMRERGLKQSLPVMVTTSGEAPAGLLMDSGFLVVRHAAGEPFHADLLDGLDVLLFVGSCDRASAVVKSLRAKQAKPLRLRSWCECYSRLDSAPVHCEVVHEWEK
jgi:hypothetical protein